MIFYRLISFILSFVNVILLVITHASHGWTMYLPKTEYNSAGLWVICSKGYGCQSIKTADVYLNITRSFMLLALLAATVAMLWSVEWDHIIHCNHVFVSKSLMTSIFSFLAGICVLVAVVVFEIKFNQNSASIDASKKWAFYLSFAICILCFLSGVYNFLNYKLSLWGTGVSTTHVHPDNVSDTEHPKIVKHIRPSLL